jgi:hypothetical protein
MQLLTDLGDCSGGTNYKDAAPAALNTAPDCRSRFPPEVTVLQRRECSTKLPGNWLAHEAGFGWQTQEHVQEMRGSDGPSRVQD